MSRFIPVSVPSIGVEEEKFVLECLRTGWLSSEGAFVRKFEEECAAYSNAKYGIAVSNGTTALQVALESLELNPGDEVILPSFTIISCIIAIIEAKAKPVLVDADPETWTLNIHEVEGKITKKTKAIMAVHMYGHPVDMEPLWSLADKYGLYIIEDTAEAHGGEYKGRKCGGLGDISALSFYANKLITTGEGGMILTNNEKFAQRASSLRNLCFKKEKRFLHDEIGHNYRLTNLQAAVGLGQLQKLDKFVERKRVMAKKYTEGLKHLPLQLPIEKPWAKNVYWMYAVVLNDEVPINAEQFSKKLLELGIETRSFFIGMHEQPVLNRMGLFNDEKYPITERISCRGFYLPSGQAITDEEIKIVTNCLNEIFQKL